MEFNKPAWSVGHVFDHWLIQGIGKDVGPRSQRTPSWEIPKPYITWVFMGHNPQESPENTINTMGTLLGVDPIAPFFLVFLERMKVRWVTFCQQKESGRHT